MSYDESREKRATQYSYKEVKKQEQKKTKTCSTCVKKETLQ